MTTGPFWDVTNPKKPVGELDPEGILDFPFDWASWLADIGSTYESHSYEKSAELEVATVGVASGEINTRVNVASGQTVVIGQKYFVTCHIVAADGQEEDQTVWFKIREK